MGEPTIQRRLERLHRRGTRYELGLISPDGRRYLVAYAVRRTRAGILSVVRDRKFTSGILVTMGLQFDEFDARARLADRAADGIKCDGWDIRWTGRTQRQAICEGELPFVCDQIASDIP